MLDRHVLTAYVGERENMRRRLADSESALGKINSELASVNGKLVEVAEKYQTQLKAVAFMLGLSRCWHDHRFLGERPAQPAETVNGQGQGRL